MNCSRHQFLFGENPINEDTPGAMLFYNVIDHSVVLFDLSSNPKNPTVLREDDLEMAIKFFSEIKR